MTDPWSVQGTNGVTNNLTNEREKQNNQQEADFSGQSRPLGFEDSFIQDNNFNTVTVNNTITTSNTVEVNGSNQHQPLPDSQAYLQSLEKKLEKLKKGTKLVNDLAEKREECLRSMLQDNTSSLSSNNEQLLNLDACVTNSDSAVQNLYRQIQPVQPVTIGETVHIVKYDQLEEQRLEAEAEATNEEQEENLPASR